MEAMQDNYTSYARYNIRDLSPTLEKAIVVGLIIYKKAPKTFSSSNSDLRAVWNFTIRDSIIDYINVTVWGTPDTVIKYNDIFQIGDIVEVRNPQINIRNTGDHGEQFHPSVTSAFNLSLNENSEIYMINDESHNTLLDLLHYPTKPIACSVNLANLYQNLDRKVDVLVAVRSVGEVRNVKTKFGDRLVRNVSLFDFTNSGINIAFWNQEEIARASIWKPRLTILFLTDLKVEYDPYAKGPKMSTTMQTIITEDPRDAEAEKLRKYAIDAVLTPSAILDKFLGSIPDPSVINNVMKVRQFKLKIVDYLNSTSQDEEQFTALIYAHLTFMDLDGLKSVISLKCSKCKSQVEELSGNCLNTDCPISLGHMVSDPEIKFDMKISISDATGSLEYCKLYGSVAEDFLKCSVEDFMRMHDGPKASLKWRYLFELCEFRLVAYLRKGKKPIISILQCQLAKMADYLKTI